MRRLAVIKEKKTSQDIDRQKLSRFRSTLPHSSSEYHNLRQSVILIPLTISVATTLLNFSRDFFSFLHFLNVIRHQILEKLHRVKVSSA